MGHYLGMLAAFTGLLLVLVLVPVGLLDTETKSAVPIATGTTQITQDESECYLLLDITTGQVVSLSAREYVIGAVCAEMPATFAPEALKAQAVAAHTYIRRQHLLEQHDPTPALCGADLSNDSTQYQAYFTKNQAMRYYGDQFEVYYNKICRAVDEVLPYILVYQDQPIVAAFCSMSAGKTESAQVAWNYPLPYLVSVDSSADMDAPRYLETALFSPEQLQQALKSLAPGEWDPDPAQWIRITQTSPSGTVISAQVGDTRLTGQQLRQALALRSAAFQVAYQDGTFTFTTRGFGHGVGMSQYGANAMANEGSTWRQILAHYYPGTQLQSLSQVPEGTA